jgi:hypothetical protein
MHLKSSAWPPSSIVLVIAGVLLVGIGLYFIFLRPPLLPEDVRYIGLASAELQSIGPRLGSWLAHVFRVMGGYITATGVLAIALAATSFREHHPVAAIGAMLGGTLSIGWMAVVNFMISSDFKWYLLAIALVWACSLVFFAWELRQRHWPGPTPNS